MSALEQTQEVPDVQPVAEAKAPSPAAQKIAKDLEASKAPTAPLRNFVSTDELIEKYLLPREKFAKALVAGGLAGGFRLFHELMMGNLKGHDLVEALKFIEKQWGLPRFGKEELADLKSRAAWVKVLGEKLGWDIGELLTGLGKKREGADGSDS